MAVAERGEGSERTSPKLSTAAYVKGVDIHSVRPY